MANIKILLYYFGFKKYIHKIVILVWFYTILFISFLSFTRIELAFIFIFQIWF